MGYSSADAPRRVMYEHDQDKQAARYSYLVGNTSEANHREGVKEVTRSGRRSFINSSSSGTVEGPRRSRTIRPSQQVAPRALTWHATGVAPRKRRLPAFHAADNERSFTQLPRVRVSIAVGTGCWCLVLVSDIGTSRGYRILVPAAGTGHWYLSVTDWYMIWGVPSPVFRGATWHVRGATYTESMHPPPPPPPQG